MNEPGWEGGCSCRTLRYRLEIEPMYVHCCHCRWCQRESGTAFALNAMVETALVTTLAGTPERIETPSKSGKGQAVLRCPQCRVAVWSHYGGAGDVLAFVRVGTLDDALLVAPDMHIYTESKQPWVIIPDTQPVSERFYDRNTHWSASSRERLEALFADKR